LPYVAERIYMVGATGLGWLVASFGVGALLGSIAVVVTGGPRHPARSMLVHTALWYLLLLGFGHVQNMGAGLVLLLCAGFVQSIAMISLMGALLQAADTRFRTRVMGVRTLAVYGMPLGLMGSGVLIDRVGYPLTVSVCCVVGLIFTLLIGIRWRGSVWERSRSAHPAVSRMGMCASRTTNGHRNR
jgi:predicted MFS family arabinose efflux permease